MTRVLLLFTLALSAFAQTPPPQTGSISGTVRDEASGQPIPDLPISAGPRNTATDSNGHYTLRDLPPGVVRIGAPPSFQTNRPAVNKQVNLGPGQDLTVNISVRPFGQISGRVVDQNREPVPGITVSLVTRHYMLGSLHYTFTSVTTTDDQGNYNLQRVEPDRAGLVMVSKRENRLESISESPLAPKLRRPAWVPTFFPGATSLEGAQPLMLRTGEHREHIDFQVLRSPSFCIEGVAQSAGAGTVHFQIAEQQPTYGTSGNGGLYGAVPNGVPGEDSKFRICNLHPGTYQMTVYSDPKDNANNPAFWSATPVTILDRDLTGLIFTAQPRIPITAEVVWEGDAPNPAPTAPLVLAIASTTRTEQIGPRLSIPGTLALDDLAMDDYGLRILAGIPKGAYLKNLTYGDKNLLSEPLHPGSASGRASLKIVLARDGATVSANVADKDGNPVPDTPVVIFPESARSEGALADAMINGQTDPSGAWTPPNALSPGKYFVIAPSITVDKSPESIAKLLRSKSKAQALDLGPGGSAQATLAVVSVE